MAGKLTIRRAGNFLPTMCLVGLLVVIGIIAWLCTAGLPGCALRYIEAEAAQAGLSLSIEKIRLSPRSGLAFKAEKVKLTLKQEDAAPVALNIRKAQIAISLARILSGEFQPDNIHIARGKLTVPLSNTPGDSLELSNIDIYTSFLKNGRGINSTLSASLHNIGIKTKILLTNDLSNPDTEQSQKETLADSLESATRQLAEFRPYLQTAKRQLDHQQWDADKHPELEFSIFLGKQQRAEVIANIPSYEVRQFHFRDASLKATAENNTLSIDHLQFKTTDPDTAVTMQCGYDWVERELEFNTKSTAPLIHMLNSYLGNNAPAVLSKIQSAPDSTPTIQLNGNANFSEDFALNRIALRGIIEHKNLKIASTAVDSLRLSFFMKDGQFNIDTFNLTLPDGFFNATAQSSETRGHAEIDFSLSDETLLTLVKDLSATPGLKLPEGLTFASNLKVRARADMSLTPFEKGKSRFEDLIPTLHSCDIQFNTEDINYHGTQLSTPAFTLHIDGIDYNGPDIKAETIKLDALVKEAGNVEKEARLSDLVINLQFCNLNIADAGKTISLENAELRTSTSAVQWQKAALDKLHATAGISRFYVNTDDITGSFQSGELSSKLSASSLTYDATTADGVFLELSVPEGLRLADTWKNMQKDMLLQADIQKLRQNNTFQATNTKLNIRNIAENQLVLDFNSDIGKETAKMHAIATLRPDKLIKLSDVDIQLPLAEARPLLGDEPIKELQLPKMLKANGSALINSQSGQLIDCNYHIQLPELVRVCQNIHVIKGKKIPLQLTVNGSFSTRDNGTMYYDADVQARHKLGELSIHVSGNPLRECHITGKNTIPIDIINALIDNADAHWIMRDFRCTPGVTRNIISDINTTIRYDKGIYVHALCKAELYNMDFLLGAIRDKVDEKGNPTGEEYLRTDLGSDPYSRIKEGKCDVEVLVQMDCIDKNGKALPERIRINLINPDLLYDNQPWLKRNNFKGGALTSRITGEAVRFNIENSTISLHKLKGTCYPAYSIGMYYAPIQHFLEDVILHNPADIETDYCIFPLSRNCDVPMKGLILAKATTGAGFQFLGTTIPLDNFSGFINISDDDVYLDRMNAQCWGGAMDGSLRIGFSGKHTTLDGYFVANNMNLKNIVASYGENFTPATCNGFIRFQADKPELEDVRAYGQVHLTDGDLMQIGLFRPIANLIADIPGNLSKLEESVQKNQATKKSNWINRLVRSIFDSSSSAIDTMQTSAYKIPFANHFLRYGIDEAFSRFDITKGHLITRDMKAKGYNLNVAVQLDIDLDTLTLNGDLWPKISSVPTVLISPITILSDFLIDIELYGDLLSPKWKFGLSKKLKTESPSLSTESQKKE